VQEQLKRIRTGEYKTSHVDLNSLQGSLHIWDKRSRTGETRLGGKLRGEWGQKENGKNLRAWGRWRVKAVRCGTSKTLKGFGISGEIIQGKRSGVTKCRGFAGKGGGQRFQTKTGGMLGGVQDTSPKQKNIYRSKNPKREVYSE